MDQSLRLSSSGVVFLLRKWWNRGPGQENYPDTYMTSRQELNRRFVEWIPRESGENSVDHTVLVLTHFPSTFAELEQELDQQDLEFQVVTEPITPHWLFQHRSDLAPNKLILGLVPQLNPELLELPDVYREGQPRRPWEVSILLAERHFLKQQDQLLSAFLRELPAKRKVGHFLALDDALFRHFSNAALRLLLEHYGMQSESVIQSPIVDRQVRMIQSRYARLVGENQPCNSPEEWLERHCPNL